MNIESMLHEEIVDEFDNLKDLEAGSEEYKTTVDGLVKLMDRAIEIEKIHDDKENKNKILEHQIEREMKEHDLKRSQFENDKKDREKEHDLKIKQFEVTMKEFDLKLKQFDEEKKDFDLKLKQFEEDQKDRFIRNCITAAGIVIPSVITVWGTLKSIEFEKEGTITTIMGRGFINKLLPKK